MTATNKGKGRVSITLPISIKRRGSELARENGVNESTRVAAVVEKNRQPFGGRLFPGARRTGQREAWSLDSAPLRDTAAPAQ